MPTSKQAIKRHIKYCLTLAEEVNDLFLEEKTKARGVNGFDENREQIDLAIMRLLQQDPDDETDIVLARFVDAVSSIGTVRYNILETLLPLAEQKIFAARRLGWKDLEADSLVDVGILYAFLGYKGQAAQYFELANKVAGELGSGKQKQEIQRYLALIRRQTKKRTPFPASRFLNAFRLIPLQLRLLHAKINKTPFSQVTILINIASVYMTLENWELSKGYYQKAISISQEQSYRLGELQASLGLLEAEISTEAGRNNPPSASTVVNLVNEFGFEWSTGFSILETLLDIAPVVKKVEIIAGQLAINNDPRASEIYRLLDQIMARTDEIVSASSERSPQKEAIFLNALRSIKNDLASILNISGMGYKNPGESQEL